MKKTVTLSLIFLVIAAAFCGCSAKADKGDTYYPIRNSYSGTVVSANTNSNNQTEIVLDTEKDKVFTITDSTEFTNGDEISIGDKIIIEAEESYNNDGWSDYIPIIELTKE